jgi:hypothetical protein
MAATAFPTTLPDAPAYMLPGVELFASGRYRGKRWSAAIIREIAENAEKLGPSGLKLFVPPAVLGHEEEQEWLERTDLPAAGYVDPDSVRAVPDESKPGEMKLVGDLVNIPREVADRIANREYSRVSAELYDRFVDDHGEAHGKVLRRLALLGAEPPQVKRLKPLGIPQPMRNIRQFAERKAGLVIRVRRDGLHTYAEAQAVDRSQLTAAAKAALPDLSSAFLDALSDDRLAELVQGVPTPQPPAQPAAAPGMGTPAAPPGLPGLTAQPVTGALPPTPTADPYSQEFADMSREELIAALTEMGQDAAELEAMPDEELQALYEELQAEGGEGGGEGGEVETMGDPATMTREELIAELAAAGQDPAGLEAKSDDELRAMYAEVVGGSTASAPAAPAAPVVPMSERTRRAPSVRREAKNLLNNLRSANKFAEREIRRIKAVAATNKRRDAEAFCDRLVREGKATPAQVKTTVLPLLLFCDDCHQVHNFTENGRTRRLSAYELKKAELSRLPKVIHFGERLDGDKAGGEDEVRKVERFADVNRHALRAGGYRDPAAYVAKFSELKKKKPSLTAKEFGIPAEYC